MTRDPHPTPPDARARGNYNGSRDPKRRRLRKSPRPPREPRTPMTSLLARLVRPRPKADHLRVTVYTRQQCCCCHQAIALVERYRRRHKFTLNEVDIDADPALRARYD